MTYFQANSFTKCLGIIYSQFIFDKLWKLNTCILFIMSFSNFDKFLFNIRADLLKIIFNINVWIIKVLFWNLCFEWNKEVFSKTLFTFDACLNTFEGAPKRIVIFASKLHHKLRFIWDFHSLHNRIIRIIFNCSKS